MKDITIQIPDNCELIQDGDTYVVRKKEEKDSKPKSWEEFCEKYSICDNDFYITDYSDIEYVASGERNPSYDRNVCVSEEEAEAFLALMQLRQLRKAWVGDWEPISGKYAACIINNIKTGPQAVDGIYVSTRIMSFPAIEMASEFCVRFKNLLEIAKILI